MNAAPRGLILVLLLTASAGTHAVLIDRGAGLIYDTVLNITWLQDANYAQTSGYDADGRMNWEQANTWAENLDYGGYSDWRLPHALPVDGTNLPLDYGFGTYSYQYFGSQDFGYDVSAPGTMYAGSTANEMAYMYFNNLGNLGYVDVDGNHPQPGWGLHTTGPFVNLPTYDESRPYWSSTEWTEGPFIGGQGVNYGIKFQMGDGFQEIMPLGTPLYAWAVRDGDAGTSVSVPEPSTLALMAIGLAGVGFAGGRKLAT